jgi:hypothetical protein
MATKIIAGVPAKDPLFLPFPEIVANFRAMKISGKEWRFLAACAAAVWLVFWPHSAALWFCILLGAHLLGLAVRLIAGPGNGMERRP